MKPLVLKYRDQYKSMMGFFVFMLILILFLSPLLVRANPFVYYYSILGSILGFLISLLLYLFNTENNLIVLTINGSGIDYYDKDASQLFEWSNVKLISAKWSYNEHGAQERVLCIITREEEEYELLVFRYFTFIGTAIPRLKRSIDYFSKGSVSFEYKSIWIWNK